MLTLTLFASTPHVEASGRSGLDIAQPNRLRRVVLDLEDLLRRVVGDLRGRRQLADALPVRPEPDVEQRELGFRQRHVVRSLARIRMLTRGDDNLGSGGRFAKSQMP